MRTLIADPDAGRSRRVAEACQGRGHVVERAPHGAAALELALERIPDVVVCPIDLPVIDGARLAEILRGNPRTRSASFIFLVKDELDTPIGMDARDAAVGAPWSSDAVLEQIEAFLERSARFGEMRADSEVEGKLSQISLADLLQLFQMNQKSGVVRLSREGGVRTGRILIRNGQVVDASVPLDDGTAIVAEKALYRLLTWRDGRFEFLPGDISEAARIRTGMRALLMEGMRQLDEFEKIRADLPSAEMRLRVCPGPERDRAASHPLAGEVIRGVAEYGRVGEVIDHCPFPDYQVLRALLDLRARGVLETDPHAEEETRPGRGVREGLLQPAQVQRLREWAGGLRPRPGAMIKVLVAAPSPSAYRPFLEALRECRDFLIDGRVVRQPERLASVTPLGHLPLGEALSLRLIGVPADARYAPIWTIAAHGMLGAIVLPGADGPGPIEAVAQQLRSARAGGVVYLLPAGANAERFRARLGELDAARVLELPEGPVETRREVMRDVFARLVP